LGALRDTQEAETVGRRGREMMLKQFDTATMISRYEAQFLEFHGALPAAGVAEKE
jgi:hypothetical protein